MQRWAVSLGPTGIGWGSGLTWGCSYLSQRMHWFNWGNKAPGWTPLNRVCVFYTRVCEFPLRKPGAQKDDLKASVRNATVLGESGAGRILNEEVSWRGGWQSLLVSGQGYPDNLCCSHKSPITSHDLSRQRATGSLSTVLSGLWGDVPVLFRHHSQTLVLYQGNPSMVTCTVIWGMQNLLLSNMLFPGNLTFFLSVIKMARHRED